jgi:hypothetical protein
MDLHGIGDRGNTHIFVEKQRAHIGGVPVSPMWPFAYRDTRYELPNIWELVRQAYVDKSLPESIEEKVGPVRHATETIVAVVDALGLASLNPPALDGIHANPNKTLETFPGIKKSKRTVNSCVNRFDKRRFIETGVVVHVPSACLIHLPCFFPSSVEDGPGFPIIGISRVIGLTGL